MSETTAPAEVRISSPGGIVVYEDSVDHFENALLRLMNLDRAMFDRWLTLAEEAEGDVLARLSAAWRELKPLARPEGVPATGASAVGPHGEVGRLWHAAIAESPAFGVVVDSAGELGWLARWDGRSFVRETEPPVYEEEYFEGDKLQAGGYGAYTEQAGWRLEKAHRQVREMRAATGLESGRVLDVGCGYGYFRVALADAGYDHDGLEISEFARRVGEESYGFSTFPGILDDHWTEWEARYDAITGFDLIEHVPDGEEFLRKVAHCLRPGGVVGLKTPNVDCPEADVFGPWYHSLKREHLLFFSPASLTAAAAAAGLAPVEVATTSHLLVGFVGRERTAAWEREGRGADIVAWYRKPV